MLIDGADGLDLKSVMPPEVRANLDAYRPRYHSGPEDYLMGIGLKVYFGPIVLVDACLSLLTTRV